MGKRNRERRAAKQKDRRRAATQRERVAGFSAFGAADRSALLDTFVAVLRTAAHAHSIGDGAAAQECAASLVAEFGVAGRDLDAAADRAVLLEVRHAWDSGWLPTDVHETVRRQLDTPLVGLVDAAVHAESRHYAAATLHPRWREALRAVPESGVSCVREWAEQHGVGRAASLAAVVEVLALLGALPPLEPLLPLPGQARYQDLGDDGQAVDQKVLAKVRALLAKAESTSFPDEAEALSAKAQELMTRYSLHRALVDHDRGGGPTAIGRRLWIDAPYPGPKALLVQAVAAANRSRAVWSEKLGFVTVIGAEPDLASVEMLSTSLLLQANRAMLTAGRHVTRTGTSRTRSFRQSFLLAYASRIGERLTEADEAGTAAEVRDDDRLLPVLAARTRVADEMTDRLFPELTHRSHAVSNAAGWGAGRAAADLALFDVHDAVAG